MEKVIKTFEVKYLQILDKDGKCDENLFPKELTNEDLKKMYEWMVFGRALDAKMIKMQRSGKMGTFASILGQEASNVGSAYAMEDDDWLFPCFRENISLYIRGVNPVNVLQMWGGDERGHSFPGSKNVFTTSVPVGTQMLHATGAAWATKLQKEKHAVMTYHGDGATSEGDFHEAMNFAGVFQVPLVFVCQNNQWAISVPTNKQTHAETLAQKAIAYGFEGIQVDGNDVFAVYKATKDALKKARDGKGPTFIECLTYRMGDHTTADDAKKYRDPKEVEEWQKKDPIDRLRKYLAGKGIWSDADEEKLQKDIDGRITKIVEEYQKIDLPKPEEMFGYTFENMTPNQEKQLEAMKENLGSVDRTVGGSNGK